jgi:hypothetical protein
MGIKDEPIDLGLRFYLGLETGGGAWRCLWSFWHQGRSPEALSSGAGVSLLDWISSAMAGAPASHKHFVETPRRRKKCWRWRARLLLGLLPRSRAAVTVDADTARPERLPLLDLLREREMRAAPRWRLATGGKDGGGSGGAWQRMEVVHKRKRERQVEGNDRSRSTVVNG